MILHTRLNMPECIERLSQPYLTDPFTTDTVNTIKRPYLPQTGLWSAYNGGNYKWAIVIYTHGCEINAQYRTIQVRKSKDYRIGDYPVSSSINCSMHENHLYGTDIYCPEVKPVLLLTVIACSLYLAIAPIILQMVRIPYDLSTILCLSLFGISTALFYKIAKMLERIKLAKFIADLLDATEVRKWN